MQETVSSQPLSDEDKWAVRLALVPGVGPAMRVELLRHFGSAQAVLQAAPSQLREVPGVGPRLTRVIASATDETDVDLELERCCQQGITVLSEASSEYPRLLREIPDPPGVLFLRGNLLPQDALLSIAIVGTRHATAYGVKQAERLAASLARAGLTIVSGLARGIDAAAHRSALEAGGRTIGVLASGVMDIYPREHEMLGRNIADRGALISENPSTSKPRRGTFPRRNRLITGLSLGVVVIEAAQRSGALVSARHAMEQGREVYAVPGRVDSRASRGCHQLLRDGAKLVETAEDVLEELGPLVEAAPREDGTFVRHPAELQLNDQEQKVLAAIADDATSIDQVVANSGIPVYRVLSTISVLEMRHLVRRLSGNTVARR